MGNEIILAKSNPEETLIEHTNRALQVLNKIQDRYSYIICEENIWENSFINILFHDFGKVSDNFQKVIRGSKDYTNYFRHELLSGVMLYILNSRYYSDNPIVLLPVFTHHKSLLDNLFQDDSNRELFLTKENVDDTIKLMLNRLENEKIFFPNSNKLNEIIKGLTLKNIYEVYKKNYFDNKIKTNATPDDRILYIKYKSILSIADWLASGHQGLESTLYYKKQYLKNKIIPKLLEENKIEEKNKFQFRTLQKDSIVNANVLAISPTGSGKTEAALLWASSEISNTIKIFYFLPTRVTSNAIFKRLIKYFGEDKVALIHSSAYYLRQELDDNYNKLEYLRDKTFFKYINIGTLDQLLTIGFNLGYWEIKNFHLLNAKVIIDEIHLYQPYTLGLTISTIKYLSDNFQTEFYIMSATIPTKLKDLLSKTLNGDKGVVFLQDKELLNQARNIYETRNVTIDELNEEISSEIINGKKILIVVNTVDEAIRLYKKYEKKTKKIMCYHSRFIQKDRISKEETLLKREKMNEPFLLIATQVVEVSLDIDYDILYTENAPIDAIIQRAGRVNRSRKKNDTKVIVFNHRQVTKDYVYTIENILEKTFEALKDNNGKRLTESDLITLVDDIYKNFDFTQTESYQTGLKAYKDVQEHLYYVMDNDGLNETYTREGIDSINVIPGKFYEQLIHSSFSEKVKYELSIHSSKRFKFDCSTKDKHGFRYISNIKYDYKTGLEFLDQFKNSLLCT
ncbi:MAG: CRISPR-associated helicase Cas3' [Spirochaetes bacterium]|nr:CRISPR-associated helicase Cas3' [Spirochaetota bacterium]